MWKDFFYFTRGQRIGIIVLVMLIFLAFGADLILPLFFPANEKDETSFLAEADAFKKSLVSIDSIHKAERQRRYEERYHKYRIFTGYKKDVKYSLFSFDPNTIDSVSIVHLGIKSYIASNILKYRRKGGVFRVSADFAKVYGINQEKYIELKPYININETKLIKTDTFAVKRKVFKQDIIVDLNSADTTLLMQVKGIGHGYARAIIRFRKSTGGFVSVDQLNEIYGMRPENFEKIRSFCTVNLDLVKKIEVNKASVERLNSHPYLSFYQAKAIYELRRNKGKLHDINELKILQEFSPEGLLKIQPYLSFK
jgi:competence ComEA-like helix-hairpin-helix protein